MRYKMSEAFEPPFVANGGIYWEIMSLSFKGLKTPASLTDEVAYRPCLLPLWSPLRWNGLSEGRRSSRQSVFYGGLDHATQRGHRRPSVRADFAVQERLVSGGRGCSVGGGVSGKRRGGLRRRVDSVGRPY